jgi:hypothetical protein
MPRIYLSPPHLGTAEQELVAEADWRADYELD